MRNIIQPITTVALHVCDVPCVPNFSNLCWKLEELLRRFIILAILLN